MEAARQLAKVMAANNIGLGESDPFLEFYQLANMNANNITK